MYYIVFFKQNVAAVPRAAGMPLAPRAHVEMGVVPAVFRCADAATACKAAAKRIGSMGSYFAVEGTPWGIDMLDVGVVEVLGEELNDTAYAPRALDTALEQDDA